MDLHLECPVTLRIRDQRRNPLRRQRRIVDEDERHSIEDGSRRNSHSCSPRLPSSHAIGREIYPAPTGNSRNKIWITRNIYLYFFFQVVQLSNFLTVLPTVAVRTHQIVHTDLEREEENVHMSEVV